MPRTIAQSHVPASVTRATSQLRERSIHCSQPWPRYFDLIRVYLTHPNHTTQLYSPRSLHNHYPPHSRRECYEASDQSELDLICVVPRHYAQSLYKRVQRHSRCNPQD